MHGSPRSAWEAMHPTDTDETLAPMLKGVSESVLIAGHTHLAMDRRVNGTRILNPGSVGLALDGHVALARYLLLDAVDEEWRATFRSLPFDLEPVLDELYVPVEDVNLEAVNIEPGPAVDQVPPSARGYHFSRVAKTPDIVRVDLAPVVQTKVPVAIGSLFSSSTRPAQSHCDYSRNSGQASC